MKLGGRMALQVDIIMSHGTTGTGRQIHHTRNIKIGGHILLQDLGCILCHITIQSLVSIGHGQHHTPTQKSRMLLEQKQWRFTLIKIKIIEVANNSMLFFLDSSYICIVLLCIHEYHEHLMLCRGCRREV